MKLNSFNSLLDQAKAQGSKRVASAGPAKAEVLRALKRGQQEGLLELILIGETSWIFQMATNAGLNLSKAEMIEEPILELPAAQIAVEQAKKGKADFIMNGYVESSYFIKAVLDTKKGIKTGRELSQLTAIEGIDSSDGEARLLYIADCGIHANPSLKEKRDILENSLQYLRGLGLKEIRVTVLAKAPLLEVKTKNHKAKESNVKTNEANTGVANADDDAEEFSALQALQDDYPELILTGPVSLEEVLTGEVPDLLLVSQAEVGNTIVQALKALKKGQTGNVILGAEVPLVLVEQKTSSEELWRSIVMAAAFCPSPVI